MISIFCTRTIPDNNTICENVTWVGVYRYIDDPPAYRFSLLCLPDTF